MVSFLGTKVKTVEAGLHHFLALTTSGELYAWGDNQQCQLGLDDPDSLCPPNNLDRVPVRIKMGEKPSEATVDGIKRTNSINASMRTSQYQGSATETSFNEEEACEAVWELEEGSQPRA